MGEKRGEYFDILKQIESLHEKKNKILSELQKECTHSIIFETTYPDGISTVNKRYICVYCGKEDSSLHPQNDLECSTGKRVWLSFPNFEMLFSNKEYVRSGKPLSDEKIKFVINTGRVN